MRTTLAEVPSVICGDFSRLSVKTLPELIEDLDRNLTFLESQAISPFVPYYNKQPFLITKGREAISRLQLQCNEQIIRRQPFGIIISGFPGCGKSFAAMRLSKALYNSVCGDLRADEIVVLNEGDEFQSEFRSSHKVVIFDDLGATRVDVVKTDPFRKIIDFINNIPRTALNPQADLKGCIWIQPEIVVATTNMILPFTSHQRRNTESILCPGAINRRFPLMLAQKGYDEFYIMDSTVERQSMEHMFVGKSYTYDELLSHALVLYKEHYEDQTKFVNTVQTALYPESLKGSLTFGAIVSLQAFVRYFIAHKAFEGDLNVAAAVAAFRNFAQLPLQDIKNAARKEIIQSLRDKGYNSVRILTFLDELQHSVVKCTTIVTILTMKPKIEDLFDILSGIIPVITNCTARAFVPGQWFLLYDVLSVSVPALLGKWANDELRESNEPPYLLDEAKKLRHRIHDSSFRWWQPAIRSVSENTSNIGESKWLKFLNWESLPSFSLPFHPIYDFVTNLNRNYQHAEALSTRNRLKLTTTDESFQLGVSRKHTGLFVPEVLLPGPQVYQILNDYKDKQATFSEFLSALGSMQCGDHQVVYGIDFRHELFSVGVYILSYTSKTNTLYVIRSMNKKLICDLNTFHWFLQCIHCVSGIDIVFAGSTEDALCVAPLYPGTLKDNYKEDLKNLFKYRFVVKSLLKVKGSKPTTIKCQVCTTTLGNHNCPATSVVAVSRVSTPPLPQHFSGNWIERETYLKASGFGHYSCPRCKKDWLSAHASRKYGQICKCCKKHVYADYFLEGEFTAESASERESTHPTAFCAACKAGDTDHLLNSRESTPLRQEW